MFTKEKHKSNQGFHLGPGTMPAVGEMSSPFSTRTPYFCDGERSTGIVILHNQNVMQTVDNREVRN